MPCSMVFSLKSFLYSIVLLTEQQLIKLIILCLELIEVVSGSIASKVLQFQSLIQVDAVY